MIEPTVGRIVWVHEGNAKEQAAIVADVISDRCISVHIFCSNGNLEFHENIPLLQDDDSAPDAGAYAQWMPYQIGLAKKHEASS